MPQPAALLPDLLAWSVPWANHVVLMDRVSCIFDFPTLTEPLLERQLDAESVRHLEKPRLEFGQGFALVGRQHRPTIAPKAPCVPGPCLVDLTTNT